MRFASPRQEKEFHSPSLVAPLREIALDLEEHVAELLVTSVWRSVAENKAAGATTLIHPYWRGVDVVPADVTHRAQAVMDDMGAYVNSRWKYGCFWKPWLQVAVTRLHGTGPHVHLQCWPGGTQRR